MIARSRARVINALILGSRLYSVCPFSLMIVFVPWPLLPAGFQAAPFPADTGSQALSLRDLLVKVTATFLWAS